MFPQTIGRQARIERLAMGLDSGTLTGLVFTDAKEQHMLRKVFPFFGHERTWRDAGLSVDPCDFLFLHTRDV